MAVDVLSYDWFLLFGSNTGKLFYHCNKLKGSHKIGVTDRNELCLGGGAAHYLPCLCGTKGK